MRLLQELQELVAEDKEIYAKMIKDAPSWSPSKAEGDYQIKGIAFSAEDGLGAVPFNQSVYYHGFVALIKPSIFLDLALPHAGERSADSKKIEELIKKGYALGPPFLQLSTVDLEDDKGPAKITGHEGRARVLAIQRLIGDEPIPIHIFLAGGLRARHLTDELIAKIKHGVKAENSKSIIGLPFHEVFVNGKSK